jgi:hypothetical protein
MQQVVTAPVASRGVLVGSVSGIEPHTIEAQREELPNDWAQGPPSSQQKLNEGCRVHCLCTDTWIFHQASLEMQVSMLFQMTDQVPAEFWLMWIVVACTLCNRSLSGMVIFGAVHSKPCFAGSSRPAVVVLWTGLKLHGPYSVQSYAQCIVGHAS